MAYFEQVQLKDEKDYIINPSTNEAIIFLRRCVKLLEASGTCDPQNRQRITIDAITAGLTLATVTTVTTVSTVTVVSAVTAITNALPAGTNTLGYIGMNNDTRTDLTRNTYANGIRRNLTFS